MKTFGFNLSNLSLKTKVKLDTSQCRTGEDLKKLVASELTLKENQFKIDNPPTKDQINSQIDKIDLNITLINLSDNIVFKLPNSKQILIKIDTSPNKKQLIDLFKKKKVYFHEATIEFLQFHLCGILLQPYFMFSVAPEGSIVHITATKNLITIKLHDYQFIFFEGQRCIDASTLIRNFLKGPYLFDIQNSITHKSISDAEFLSKNIQYCVYNRKLIHFHHINSSESMIHNIDVLTKISELRVLLANIYSEKYIVKPTSVFIYDKDKIEITDPDATLLSLPKDFSNLYFDYEIKADGKNQKKEKIAKDDQKKKKPEFQPNKKHNDNNIDVHNEKKVCWWINFKFKSKPELNLSEILPIDTKMSQISSLIAKKRHIKDEIEISYKENDKFIKIDDDKSIFDVKGHIRINGKNGFHNYLFVEIKSKKTVNNYDDEDDEAQQNQLKERRDVRDVQNKKQKNDKNKQKPKSYNDDDDDDDNEDDSSSSQKVHKPKKIERKNINDKKRPKSKESYSKKYDDENSDNESSKSPSKKILVDDDDDDSDDLPNKRQKGRNEEDLQKKKGQKDNDDDDKNEQKKNSLESYKSKYSFKYGNSNKNINLRNDFHLKENEDRIKLFLKIDMDETLDFFIINDKNKEEEVDAENVVMQSLKDKLIIVKIHKNLKANLAGTRKSSSHKYFYQINSESKINEIVLDSNATVLSLKEAIAEKNDVDDIINIKILFAGKDLLNSIVLESLELGSDILYVYIRSMEDVLLMTAKALKV